MLRRPERYWPVSDSLDFSSPATEPLWTTRPPCSPAPGPTSTTWSATRIVSSSCSTTSTVLPMSRSRCNVSISLWLSRWCSPIDGSSRTYSTPTSPEPICEAKRIRWASPPDSVAADRSSERYSSPTSQRNRNRTLISLRICSAIIAWRSSRWRSMSRSVDSAIDSAHSWWMLSPSMVTASASGLSRAPPHVPHGTRRM